MAGPATHNTLFCDNIPSNIHGISAESAVGVVAIPLLNKRLKGLSRITQCPESQTSQCCQANRNQLHLESRVNVSRLPPVPVCRQPIQCVLMFPQHLCASHWYAQPSVHKLGLSEANRVPRTAQVCVLYNQRTPPSCLTCSYLSPTCSLYQEPRKNTFPFLSEKLFKKLSKRSHFKAFFRDTLASQRGSHYK